MIPILAQARFPAPEFENYILPQLQLETFIRDPIVWRVSALLFFLAVTGLCFYRWRSAKAMRLLALAGVVIFGFLFTACPCPVGMFQNLLAAFVHDHPLGYGLLLLFAIPLATALFFGRLFCAGACPLGAVQELLHWKSIQIPDGASALPNPFGRPSDQDTPSFYPFGTGRMGLDHAFGRRSRRG